VKHLAKYAKSIKESTPLSFQFMIDKLKTFQAHTSQSKEMNKIWNPKSFLAMPIMFNELLSICYKNMISCAEIKCQNFYKKLEINNAYSHYDLCPQCSEKNKQFNNNNISNNEFIKSTDNFQSNTKFFRQNTHDNINNINIQTLHSNNKSSDFKSILNVIFIVKG